MTAWKRQRFFPLMMKALLLSILTSQVLGASNYIRVPLGNGASIEVPKNWVVFSENRLITLDAYVEAKGAKQAESTLSFAANLYDDEGKTLALVNARFYPNNPMTQVEAQQLSSTDRSEFDMEIRKAIREKLEANGAQLLNWYGSKVDVINGLYVIVHEHQYAGSGDSGITRVRGLRVWRSPRSFTVTLSYQERDAAMISPIIDYMTSSLRQD